MSDPLTWSPISLGRWFGTPVRVHILLILFVAFRLLAAALAPAAKVELRVCRQTACWLGLLLLALAVHELGHAVTAAWLDCDQEDVRLWPLGNLVGPVARAAVERALPGRAGRAGHQRCASSWSSAIGLNLFAGAQFVWNPFGNAGGRRGAAGSASGAARHAARRRVWSLGWFGYLNWVLAAGQPDPGPPVRRRPDAPRLSWRSTSVVSSRDNIARPLDGPRLRRAAGARRPDPAAVEPAAPTA